MTTDKQAAANKTNSQNSTGAKTPEGKAAVSNNAIKHGLLSKRILIAGENAEDYSALLNGLLQSIAPEGMLEQMLVEKVAVALWRQQRLVAAESAAITLGKRMEHHSNQTEVNMALNLYDGLGNGMSMTDLQPASEDDKAHIEWCKNVLDEYQALDDEVIVTEDLGRLAKEAPLMFEQLDNGSVDEDMDVKQYTAGCLRNKAWEVINWCATEIVKFNKLDVIQEVVKLVQVKASAPVSNELMLRYSAALDNELYRAIEALRKQQEFRLRSTITVDAEAA